MPGFASETTPASAQEDTREKPANMVMFQVTCYEVDFSGMCLCECQTCALYI